MGVRPGAVHRQQALLTPEEGGVGGRGVVVRHPPRCARCAHLALLLAHHDGGAESEGVVRRERRVRRWVKHAHVLEHEPVLAPALHVIMRGQRQ